MLPSDMNLKIRSGTGGYNNKILVSNGNFSLGKNEKVNSMEAPAMKSHKVLVQTTATHRNLERTAATHRDLEQTAATHEEEKIALILSLTRLFIRWNMF